MGNRDSTRNTRIPPSSRLSWRLSKAWSTDDNVNDNEEQVETPQENDVGKDDDDEDAFGFFSALAFLKE
jgi:hypothetical protein